MTVHSRLLLKHHCFWIKERRIYLLQLLWTQLAFVFLHIRDFIGALGQDWLYGLQEVRDQIYVLIDALDGTPFELARILIDFRVWRIRGHYPLDVVIALLWDKGRSISYGDKKEIRQGRTRLYSPSHIAAIGSGSPAVDDVHIARPWLHQSSSSEHNVARTLCSKTCHHSIWQHTNACPSERRIKDSH